MGTASTIVTSVLTSAAVTAVITTLLGHMFDKRLMNTEKRLDRVYDNLLETDRCRRQTFQRIAGQVHRTRNTAKELSGQQLVDEGLLGELKDVVKSLETDIYEFRLILEMEGVFIYVHAFKNEAKAITGLFRDLAYYQANAMIEQPNARLAADIRTSYAEIDLEYLGIIERLTARSKATSMV